MKVDQTLPTAYSIIVLDTNVLLSAALSPKGAPAQLVDRLLTQAQIVFSEQTFAELRTRLWKPKFDRYITMERRQSVLHDFNAIAHWVNVPGRIATMAYSRDSTDDAFIHAAIAAGACRLVTGDDDLLCLNPIKNLDLCILTLRQALDEIVGG